MIFARRGLVLRIFLEPPEGQVSTLFLLLLKEHIESAEQAQIGVSHPARNLEHSPVGTLAQDGAASWEAYATRSQAVFIQFRLCDARVPQVSSEHPAALDTERPRLPQAG
jgi:hypothetical protein